jgi:predicted transcriptional regulator
MGSCSSLVRPKTIKLVFFASLVKYATLRRKSKDWLALNQYNVSKWDDNFYFDNTVDSHYLDFDGTMEKIRVNRSSTQEELRRYRKCGLFNKERETTRAKF